MSTHIRLIVGLANPGPEYAKTRHNAGAWVIEELARIHQLSLKEDKKYFGFTAKFSLHGETVYLLIPTTFMNLSGKSVVALANFYQIQPEEILVIHDELDLPIGTAKFKKGGGHGGHNGLRDIIKALGNNKNFARLRIGIDHPGNAKLVSGYVLRKAPANEQQQIEDSIANALRVLPKAVAGDWNDAMKELHTK